MTAFEIFRLVGTEFASIGDEEVNKWIELTKPFISEKRFGRFYEQALAYLTAHRMKMSGLGDTALGTIGDSLRVSSYSEGETSVSFSVNQQTNMLADAELALTQYGLSYLTIRRLVIIPIRSAGEA